MWGRGGPFEKKIQTKTDFFYGMASIRVSIKEQFKNSQYQSRLKNLNIEQKVSIPNSVSRLQS